MKVKSYTFHYWRDGKRKSKTYKVDNKNINMIDAKDWLED